MAKAQATRRSEPERDAAGGIGVKLRPRRNIRGQFLQEVATAASISIGQLSEIEREIATPTLKVPRSICQALDMPMGWLPPQLRSRAESGSSSNSISGSAIKARAKSPRTARLCWRPTT